jgi:ankyrin repeat protein
MDAHRASSDGRLIAFLDFLSRRGTSLDSTNPAGQSPLHLAVKHSSLAIVRMLLDQGVDINIKDHDGSTPLHLAVIRRRFDLAQLLIEHGADPNVKNACGASAVHLAIEPGPLSANVSPPPEITIIP